MDTEQSKLAAIGELEALAGKKPRKATAKPKPAEAQPRRPPGRPKGRRYSGRINVLVAPDMLGAVRAFAREKRLRSESAAARRLIGEALSAHQR